MYRLCWFVIAAALMALAAPTKAKAEYCWMIGCEDRRGYVFIPDVQYIDFGIRIVDGLGRVRLKGKEYALLPNRPVFKKFGLPAPGSVSVLSMKTGLLSPEEIRKNFKNFTKSSIQINDEEEYDASYYRPMYHGKTPPVRGPAYPMAEGTKLKILGYRTFGGDVAGGMPLFALVLVLEDG